MPRGDGAFKGGDGTCRLPLLLVQALGSRPGTTRIEPDRPVPDGLPGRRGLQQPGTYVLRPDAGQGGGLQRTTRSTSAAFRSTKRGRTATSGSPGGTDGSGWWCSGGFLDRLGSPDRAQVLFVGHILRRGHRESAFEAAITPDQRRRPHPPEALLEGLPHLPSAKAHQVFLG